MCSNNTKSLLWPFWPISGSHHHTNTFYRGLGSPRIPVHCCLTIFWFICVKIKKFLTQIRIPFRQLWTMDFSKHLPSKTAFKFASVQFRCHQADVVMSAQLPFGFMSRSLSKAVNYNIQYIFNFKRRSIAVKTVLISFKLPYIYV